MYLDKFKRIKSANVGLYKMKLEIMNPGMCLKVTILRKKIIQKCRTTNSMASGNKIAAV